MDIKLINRPQILRTTSVQDLGVAASVPLTSDGSGVPVTDSLSLLKRGLSVKATMAFVESKLPEIARDPRAFGMTGVMTNLFGEPITNKFGSRWTGTATGAAIGIGIGLAFGSAVGLRSVYLAQEALGGFLAGAATGFASSGGLANRNATLVR